MGFRDGAKETKLNIFQEIVRISIVMPVYNKADQVARSIQSVLAQRHADWELIAVDDGSSDGSGEVVGEFNDPRIRFIEQKNQGVCVARNHGVRVAESEWVAFLDADDEYGPEFLLSLEAFIARHGRDDLNFVSTNLQSDMSALPYYEGVESGVVDYFALCTGAMTPATSSSTIVRRDALLRLGGFPDGMKLFEDWTCWMRLAADGKFGFLEEVHAIYHQDVKPESRASGQRRTPGEIASYAIRLLDVGGSLLKPRPSDDRKRRAIGAYLNRFLLRSACPHLCRNGGVFQAWLLVRRYSFTYGSLSDGLSFLGLIKLTCKESVRALLRWTGLIPPR